MISAVAQGVRLRARHRLRVVSFGDLLVIVLAGLGGPLLALTPRFFVPLMIGEIVAGALVGEAGLGAVHPASATTSFLSQVGFAMLMLSAGMHLPLRDPRLFASLREGALVATVVGVLAVPAGLAIGHWHRGAFLAVNAAGVGRAIPSFGVLAFVFPFAIRYLPGNIGYWPTLIALVLFVIAYRMHQP